jgi:D-beta-D-heptose 7-phosphate kinase/D-beta-D-heptose 1-phosphate adenosyltransferase
MDTAQQKKFKILLLGDGCTDVYQYGLVDRISPEAPVPVFVPTHKETKPGMAGNVHQNLKALGCEVNFQRGSESTKTRFLDMRSKQQLLRVDDDVIAKPMSFETLSLDLINSCDAIVISDYDKGFITYEMIDKLIITFAPKPIFIDTKKTDLAKLEGAFVKINSLEYTKIKSECSNLIVTIGKHGASYKGKDYPAPSIDVTDVCGAGDTFLAALANQYLASNGNIDEAMKFAIRASAVTVQHTGVYAPTLEEISCV